MKKTVVSLFLSLLIVGIFFPSNSVSAQSFNPENIIEESDFTNSNSMTAQSIQAFLDARNSTCLKNYQTPEPLGNNQYGGNVSAAQAILKAGQLYNISPKVLLVTLQKEQGLITRTDCPDWRYRTAMGFGCPDGSPCDEQWFGLSKQLYQGARHFRGFYNSSSGWYVPYKPGNYYVQWHPNSGCGGTVLNIRNRSTASLYSYTPYQPNQAALNAGYGVGDGCSSYGNRNFWLYFRDWFGFGAAPQPEPVPLTGDWNGDGKDTVSIKTGNSIRIDINGDGNFNSIYTFGNTTDVGVAGDWNGDGKDTISLKRNAQIFIDNDGNGTADSIFSIGEDEELPISGDWDNDGRDEIGYKDGARYHLDYDNNGNIDSIVHFGYADDDPLIGDRNGDGKDTISLKRDNRYFIDQDGDGSAESSFYYSFTAGTYLLSGDWNGDGRDTIGFSNGSTHQLSATEGYDPVTTTTLFGNGSDTPIVGDWDGDGDYTVSLKRGNNFFIDEDGDGIAESAFKFGNGSDTPIVGDWDGDGDYTVSLKRGNNFFIDEDGDGIAESAFKFGNGSDTPIVGDWDGDGDYTVSLKRGNNFFIDEDGDGIAESAFKFGNGSDKVLTGDRNADNKTDIALVRGNRLYFTFDLQPTSDDEISYGTFTTHSQKFLGAWSTGESKLGLKIGNRYELHTTEGLDPVVITVKH